MLARTQQSKGQQGYTCLPLLMQLILPCISVLYARPVPTSANQEAGVHTARTHRSMSSSIALLTPSSGLEGMRVVDARSGLRAPQRSLVT
jgi:hypothetical protein